MILFELFIFRGQVQPSCPHLYPTISCVFKTKFSFTINILGGWGKIHCTQRDLRIVYYVIIIKQDQCINYIGSITEIQCLKF